MKKIVLVLAAVMGVALAAAPAFAHVTVDPAEANQGGFATLTFKVPNEKDDASTVQVEVEIPTDKPIASVSVQPIPGWTAAVTKTPLSAPVETDDGQVSEAVSKITWSGGEIQPGQFQQFPVSMGPLPKADELVFKTLQTYSDGDVVRWIEVTPAGGEEPEHPAPVLTLEKVAEGADHHAAADSDDEASATKDDSDSHDDSSSDTLAIVAIVVAGLGVILGGVALARTRTRTN
jgi:periplasmic copper chaperone A